MADGSKHGGIKGAENSSKQVMGTGAALIGGALVAIFSAKASSNQKKKTEQQRQRDIENYKSQISDIDHKIANYRSAFKARDAHKLEDSKVDGACYRKMCDRFREINVNPVPLPSSSKIKKLPSLFRFLQ